MGQTSLKAKQIKNERSNYPILFSLDNPDPVNEPLSIQ
jgi:hypothetical protein